MAVMRNRAARAPIEPLEVRFEPPGARSRRVDGCPCRRMRVTAGVHGRADHPRRVPKAGAGAIQRKRVTWLAAMRQTPTSRTKTWVQRTS